MIRPIVHIAETKDFSPEVLEQVGRIADLKTDDITQAELRNALNECDVFWFRLKFKINADVLNPDTRCRYIVTPVTGLDHIDLDACKKLNISVLSLRGEREFLRTVRATAEHTIGLTLMLLRHSVEAVLHTRDSLWNRDLFKGTEIYQKTVGIVGVGRLGTITAEYFRAFGAKVYGYDVEFFNADICTPATLPDLLAASDIVSVHLAYNASTHHFFDRRLFRRMNPHAVLINTARGGVINSEDLVWALENKMIAGAALDVIEDEYDREGNVLIDYTKRHSNLIITPHIGGNTYESFQKTEMFLLERLKSQLNDNV